MPQHHYKGRHAVYIGMVTPFTSEQPRRLCRNIHSVHFGMATPFGRNLQPYMSICARIVVAVTLHEVDSPPNAKTCAKRDNQSLQYTNCAVKEIHINLAFCRFAAQKMLLKMKMPPLFLGGCVLVGQIYFVYVKGFIGLYDCRTGRHIPFHVKSVSFVEVGKVFVVRVFRDVVFVA